MRQERDPLGADTGAHDPYRLPGPVVTYSDIHEELPLFSEGGNPFDFSSGCAIDGMPASCSEVRDRMEAGSVANEHMVHDHNGWRTERDPFTPFGLGLFGLDVPTGRQTLEGDITYEGRLFHHGQPQRTPGQQCDDKLAQIFGDGNNAVFATDRDPDTLLDEATAGRNRLDSPNEDPRRGASHIYASRTGEGVKGGNLFTPDGFTGRPESGIDYAQGQSGEELQNYHRFTYLPGALTQRYGYTGGLAISFIHTGPTNRAGVPYTVNRNVRNGEKSVLIGTIGAFGNSIDVGGSSTGYVHTHIIFYETNKRGERIGRIDPRRVFCREFGFR